MTARWLCVALVVAVVAVSAQNTPVNTPWLAARSVTTEGVGAAWSNLANAEGACDGVGARAQLPASGTTPQNTQALDALE